MQLSVIIVNYNSKELLKNCIESVINATKDIEVETIIIDNNSTDDSWDYISSLQLTGMSFRMNNNLGFAKASNGGFGFSQGKYILFLNPDTILPRNSLQYCVSFLERNNDAGAVGVRMIDGNGIFLKESRRGFPGPATSFFKLFGLTILFPRSKMFARYYMGHLPEQEDNPVEVLSGAFMMIKREALEKTKGFDEDFFMYGEDIDLSIRLIKAGYKNYYLGSVTITHLKGGSTNYNYKYVNDFYQAMNLFIKKHYREKPMLYRLFLYAGIGLRKWIAVAGLLFR